VPTHIIVLDVETGTDDALAILSAVQHPEISIAGISYVAGKAGRQIVETETAETLVCLAPQTNVAMLLTQHPEVADHLQRILHGRLGQHGQRHCGGGVQRLVGRGGGDLRDRVRHPRHMYASTSSPG